MSISMISKAEDDGTTEEEEEDSCSSFETSAAGASNPSRDIAAEGEARAESSILIASSKADSRLSMLVSQFPDDFFFEEKARKERNQVEARRQRLERSMILRHRRIIRTRKPRQGDARCCRRRRVRLRRGR